MIRQLTFVLLCFVAVLSTAAMSGGTQDCYVTVSLEEKDSALWVVTTDGILYLQPYASGSVHVMYGTAGELKSSRSYAVAQRPAVAPFKVSDDGDVLRMTTANFTVDVDKSSGDLRLTDASGRLLVEDLSEGTRGKVVGDSVRPACKFRIRPDDALYGLGEFRDGLMKSQGRTA